MRMAKQARRSAVLLPFLFGTACGASGPGPSTGPEATGLGAGGAHSASGAAKPNIVVIVTDDLDVGSLEYMPKLRAFMAGVGTSFSNSFTVAPVCCPSRATMLRGQYAHNHRVLTNGRGNNSCFDDFRAAGLETSTVATWLQAAGYRTSLLGKYLNRYPVNRGVFDDSYVPPGWDHWFAIFNADFNSDAYFQYFANYNKRLETYGKKAEEYSTDVLTNRAREFIKGNEAAGSKPFLLWIATTAPHANPVPAPRHENAHADKRAPRTPNFNEADLADKPRWYRDNLPLLTNSDVSDLDWLFRKRLETLQSVDDMVEKIIDALAESGTLGNSYLFFTSDNGFLSGNHRFPSGKEAPYEESIRVPLIVRGPGVPAGVSLSQQVSNLDLAPTFAELAHAQTPGFVDGRSLVPLLSGASPSWRQDLLIEHQPVDSGGLPTWFALRNGREVFVDYQATNEEEYYDLEADPFQTESKHRAIDPQKKRELKARIGQLQGCAGASCRQ
jgi:arylsulfatase A-like enzyme